MTTPHDATLYAHLGLTPEASHAEITRAYRALLREHHPDTRAHQHRLGPASAPSPSAPEQTEVSISGLASSSDEALTRAVAAYAVLADPARRASYDHQQCNHRAGGEQHTQAESGESAGPRPPTKPVVGPFRPAGATPAGSPRQGPPPIQVGPVRWHRVSPTTTRRP